MSLLKQLLASVTLIMGLILVGSTMVSVDALRQYLNGQLQSQSDNTASALALLLSQPANQDPAIRETLMTALFDSGQFRAIRLTAADGIVLFERAFAPRGDEVSVPDWFRRLLPLKSAEAARDVTNGWKQVGVVSVIADNASADLVLWRSLLRLLILVLAVGVGWALLVVMFVQWFKKALAREIRSQLVGLEGGAVTAPVPNPSPVRGLNDVSQALQDAKAQVQARGRAMSERIDSLEAEVNHDPITGLPNRKYFIDRVASQSGESKDGDARPGSAYILLARQHDLSRINAVMARADADQWLRRVAQSILPALQGGGVAIERYVLARLNGSDFALLMYATDHADALMQAHSVRRALDQLRVALDDDGLCRWSYALASLWPQADIGEILSSLDLGLMGVGSPDDGAIKVIEQGRS